MRLYHGGKPGLVVGDLIVPGERHYVDGCDICEAKKRGENLTLAGTAIDPINRHEDRVYVTSDRDYGRFYASKYPTGDLYGVEIPGESFLSDEDPFETFVAESARVVRMTAGQRRTLMRRWRMADSERGAHTFNLAMPYPTPGAGRMHS